MSVCDVQPPEYAPGSEIFLVYTDERDMTPHGLAPPPAVRGLKNRAFVVKINRLLSYESPRNNSSSHCPLSRAPTPEGD